MKGYILRSVIVVFPSEGKLKNFVSSRGFLQNFFKTNRKELGVRFNRKGITLGIETRPTPASQFSVEVVNNLL